MSGWQERRWGHVAGSGLGTPKGRKNAGAGGRGSGMRRGRGRGGGIGGGGGFGPVSELITIPSDHGSREYDILTIDGVGVADFSFVQIALRDLFFTGHTGSPDIGIRFSTDGGSTWISGASDYRTIEYSAIISNGTDRSYGVIADFAANDDNSILISNLNAVMPTTAVTHELGTSVVNPARWGIMTKNSVAIHDAIQIYIGGGGGTPVFEGGTLDLVGYK